MDIALNYIKNNKFTVSSYFNEHINTLEVEILKVNPVLNVATEDIGSVSLSQVNNIPYQWYITIEVEENHQKNNLSYILLNRLMIKFKKLIESRKMDFNNLITIGIDTDASGGFWDRFMKTGRYSVDNEKRFITNIANAGFEKEIGALSMYNLFV